MRFEVAFGCSVILSVFLHALLAAGVVGLLEMTSASPDMLAQLDLSSVELSFAEKEDDAAAVQPVLASAPAEPVTEMRPPESVPPPVEPQPPRPPEPEALCLPEPQPSSSPLQTPERPKPTEEPKPAAPSPAARPVAAAAPRQARVDAPPRPRRSLSPDYPKGARLRGEQGNVTLEIRVSARGTVEGVEVVASSGFRELDAAAEKAVRAARFTPAQSKGRAVPAPVRVTLAFRLR